MLICMYGWRSHLWHKISENTLYLHGWALATLVKGVKIRLRKNWLSVLAERKSLSVEIAGGVMNLWLIMMDIGCAVYDMVYVIKSLWISEHALHF